MDFIQQVRVFLAVAEQGSFARAAEALRLTRPSVTNTIRALEAQLGARLFQRTTRRTSLTTEGEQFYERAQHVLAAVSDAQHLFGGAALPPRGRLRVDMPNSIARPLVIPRLMEFTHAYPEVDLILGVSDQMVDLVAEGVDCVLRVGEPVVSSMVGRVVGHIKVVTCAAPGYLKAHGVPKTLKDLEAHQILRYFSGRDRRMMDWFFTHREGRKTMRIKPALLVNDHEALVACVVNGMGLAQLVAVAVREELRRGELVEVLPQTCRGEQPVSILYPARQHLAPQVRAFVDWVAEVLRE